jgi:hypothetical protein
VVLEGEFGVAVAVAMTRCEEMARGERKRMKEAWGVRLGSVLVRTRMG